MSCSISSLRCKFRRPQKSVPSFSDAFVATHPNPLTVLNIVWLSYHRGLSFLKAPYGVMRQPVSPELGSGERADWRYLAPHGKYFLITNGMIGTISNTEVKGLFHILPGWELYSVMVLCQLWWGKWSVSFFFPTYAHIPTKM